MFKLKLVFLILALFSFGCGKNAFINAESKNSNLLNPLNSNKEELSIKSLSAQDIELGVFSVPAQFNIPIYLLNTSSESISSVILSSEDLEVTLLENQIDNIKVGKSIAENIASIKITQASELNLSLNLEYISAGKKVVEKINITGLGVSAPNIKDAEIAPIRLDLDVINHGKIKLGSLSTVETLLENKEKNSALVLDIKIIEGEEFELIDSSNCIDAVLEDCKITTSYKPNSIGKHNDFIEITYSTTNDRVKKIKIPLVGESVHTGVCSQDYEAAVMALEESFIPKLVKESVRLPYRIDIDSTDIILETLFGDAYNKTDNPLDPSYRYVEDAQILSYFDLSIPEGSTIIDMKIYTEILKSYQQAEGARFLKTEIICIENSLICSGNKFFEGGYAEHNTDLFSVASDNFSKAILNEGQKESMNLGGLYRLNKTFNFSDLFTTQEFDIYSQIKTDKNTKVIFADDIKIEKNPLLKVKYRKELNNCK